MGRPLAFPAIPLGGTSSLHVSFDELTESASDYSFTIIHCNADWTADGLLPIDYLETFAEDDITDYAFSVNTMVDYIHYSFTIPNERIRPTLSGNYIVNVYPRGLPDQPVLQRRFYIYESGLSPANIAFSRPIGEKQWESAVELGFDFECKSLRPANPLREIKAVVMQNGRTNRTLDHIVPKYNGGSTLAYTFDSKILFEGEREFRRFEIKNLKYNGKGIDSIRYEVPYFHAYTEPARLYTRGPYYYNEDLNGRFFIDLELMDNDSVQADYVYVHFALVVPLYDTDNDYYVTGAWADWRVDESTRLAFEYQTKSYKATALLKQGFYDYAFYARNRTTGEVWFPEKSFYETGNLYQILFYYQPTSERYHRLVSFTEVNSLER